LNPSAPASNTIEITLAGDPAATPRLRFTKSGRKYTPNTADDWKHAIGVALLRTGWRRPPEPITCPFSVQVVCYFERPKSLAKARPEALPKGSKPDLDNLAKAVLDQCTDSGVWRDDAQVFDLHVIKLWAAAGAAPGARITITAHPEFDHHVARPKRPLRNQQQPSLPGRPG
jgi:Holliday junction resolvase RusA-like endonuclease